MARPKGTTKRNAKRKTLPRARVTQKEYNRIRLLAEEYAGGNLSKWLVHGALTAERSYLK